MREFFGLFSALLVVAVGLVAVVDVGYLMLGGASLVWLPFQQRMETSITRASPGYVTAQQEQLRDLLAAYRTAAPSQRAAIRLQMQEVADKIPGYVQPDIASFLDGNP